MAVGPIPNSHRSQRFGCRTCPGYTAFPRRILARHRPAVWRASVSGPIPVVGAVLVKWIQGQRDANCQPFRLTMGVGPSPVVGPDLLVFISRFGLPSGRSRLGFGSSIFGPLSYKRNLTSHVLVSGSCWGCLPHPGCMPHPCWRSDEEQLVTAKFYIPVNRAGPKTWSLSWESNIS